MFCFKLDKLGETFISYFNLGFLKDFGRRALEKGIFHFGVLSKVCYDLV